MNRIDRLFAITVLLQARRRMRAADLAALFEVSERTIYRDIEALNESGIPIISTPGIGYELMEGYFLPAIQLTPDEAKALFLGVMMLKSGASGSLLGNVESALAKITQALPEQVSAEANRLADIMRFFSQPGGLDFEDSRLLVLQKAIQEKRVVWIRYHSYTQDETTQREIEPEALQYGDGAWYIIAYCRLRHEPRSFRLSRVEALRLHAETFLPRRMFSAPASPVEIRVRFEPGVVRWVRERQHYSFIAEEPDKQGERVIMTYRVQALRELQPWLLSWGAAAEILGPDDFRASLAAEISSLYQKYISE